jgi:hypothetical protein
MRPPLPEADITPEALEVLRRPQQPAEKCITEVTVVGTPGGRH